MGNKKEKIGSITHAIKFVTGILSWVVLVILVMIAGFLLYYFVSMKIYAQKGEDFRPAISLYTILTGSMIPNINPDDVIVDIRVTNPEDIKVGDVITFISTSTLSPGMTISHRVIDIKQENGETLYYTKGDANLSPDSSPAKFSNVLGKVIFHIPLLGKLQHFLATKGGWLIIVVIPALFIIISDILKIFRLYEAKNHVNSTLENEEKERKINEEYKDEIERRLKDRYVSKRNPYEPDPIPKKTYISIFNGMKPRINRFELPKRIDLPKLKNDTVVDRKDTSLPVDSKLQKKQRKRKKKI